MISRLPRPLNPTRKGLGDMPLPPLNPKPCTNALSFELHSSELAAELDLSESCRRKIDGQLDSQELHAEGGALRVPRA